MGIEALEAPTKNSRSKYDFEESELKSAAALIKEGKWPGNKGYENEGQARSGATRLIEQLNSVDGLDFGDLDPADFGSRVWDTGNKKDGYAFVLKGSKRVIGGGAEGGGSRAGRVIH